MSTSNTRLILLYGGARARLTYDHHLRAVSLGSGGGVSTLGFLAYIFTHAPERTHVSRRLPTQRHRP
ncbi:hypothetical protein FKP32DRAFT_1587723 [Trametes sanguinea]|nr:hypothetical protein FKP32DRAFT_1587723 [Trametes sanguinea]